jgi:hypothetical protein
MAIATPEPEPSNTLAGVGKGEGTAEEERGRPQERAVGSTSTFASSSSSSSSKDIPEPPAPSPSPQPETEKRQRVNDKTGSIRFVNYIDGVPEDIFDKARKICMNTICVDVLPRFRESALCREMIYRLTARVSQVIFSYSYSVRCIYLLYLSMYLSVAVLRTLKKINLIHTGSRLFAEELIRICFLLFS